MSYQTKTVIVHDDGVVNQRRYDFVEELVGPNNLVGAEGKCGLIDKNGYEICEPVYDEIREVYVQFRNRPNMFFYAVRLNKKCGYLDSTGKPICDLVYDFVCYFVDEIGLAIVCKDGKLGIIDITGKETCECKYDNIGYVKDELAKSTYFTRRVWWSLTVPNVLQANGKYGILGANGECITKLNYDFIDSIGLCFRYMSNNRYGVILQDGTVASEPIYSKISPSQDVLEISKDGLLGLMDPTTGEVLLPCEYTKIKFEEEFVIVTRFKNNFEYTGIVSLEDFSVLVPCDYASICGFSEGIARVLDIFGTLVYFDTEKKRELPHYFYVVSMCEDFQGEERKSLLWIILQEVFIPVIWIERGILLESN